MKDIQVWEFMSSQLCSNANIFFTGILERLDTISMYQVYTGYKL